jgi:phage tail-like protein
MTTPLDSALGVRQGRLPIDPLGRGGGPVVVLGHADAGVRAWLATGDGVALVQDVVLGGEGLIVAAVRTRAGAAATWELGWDIAGVPRARVPVPPGDGAAAIGAVIGDLAGPASLALVLRCVAGGPEVELPTVVVGEVTLAAALEPVVLNPVPAADATAVPRNTSVAVSVVDPAHGRLDLASVQVWIDGVAAVVAGGIVLPFNGSGAVVVPEVRGVRITLVPLHPFASSAAVAVRVAARTTDGRATDQTYGFQVEDRRAPTLIAAFQGDLAHVDLVFDEPVAVPAAAAVVVVPRTAPAVAARLDDLVAEGPRLRGRLAQPLTSGVAYDVVVDDIVDQAGNPVTPGTRAPLVVAAVPGHRLALWPQLPRVLRRTDADGHLQRLVACWQDVVDLLVARDDRARRQLDPRTADDAMLDTFLADLGSPFPYALDTDGKRRLVLALAAMYRLKGTAPGLEAGLRFLLGIRARVRPFAQDAARLGRARLGRDFRLAPAARFARYAFELEVDRALTDAERQAVRWWVTWHKPAHTHLTRIREPGPTPVRAAWRLGRGALGDTTYMGAA